jgi:hypothetical protein
MGQITHKEESTLRDEAVKQYCKVKGSAGFTGGAFAFQL